MGQERWPNLQWFLSQRLPNAILGDTTALPHRISAALTDIAPQARSAIATECWDFMTHFKDRYDDWAFLRDGFGVSGTSPPDNRGKGHTALARMKLLYDALAEVIRTDQPDWKPSL